MAVKVISHTPDASAVKRTVCKHCGVTLEFTRADTTQRIVRDYIGDGELTRYLGCPVCHYENVVN